MKFVFWKVDGLNVGQARKPEHPNIQKMVCSKLDVANQRNVGLSFVRSNKNRIARVEFEPVQVALEQDPLGSVVCGAPGTSLRRRGRIGFQKSEFPVTKSLLSRCHE
ncbi:hypothetical protein OGAPHI_003900 [Ogataea philodendri]|uniref:Uncharacterized protein n=1 Tax=Ogataea philodendri TaxID=1378263 RepID=A0A9P8P6A8_9ASCO|nr:uncharacterized protein OGAPHI_003900 [Ogataea philodendri]KAH3665712.1 hypothetical protein OGAPHI_003900 [Ogataea philodendri]